MKARPAKFEFVFWPCGDAKSGKLGWNLMEKHGFVSSAPSAQGSHSFALIFKHCLVIQNMPAEIDARLYCALMTQAMAIGAQAESPAQPADSLVSPPQIAGVP